MRESWRGRFGWCFYDWANSAFPTVILTFIFSTYFTQSVAVDATRGTTQWGYAQSLAGLAVALTAPFLGSLADSRHRLKPWVGGFTSLCCLACLALWMIEPTSQHVIPAIVLVVIAGFSFEAAQTFYNALLPGLAGPKQVGRLSGWAWGCGYAGGLACLVVALVALVGDDSPWFGLDPLAMEGVRAVGPLVALWLALFAVPFFIWTPDRPATFSGGMGGHHRRDSWFDRLKTCARRPLLWRFLLAHMLYADGLVTLFAFGGIFAAGVYGLSLAEVIYFGIAINVTAGLGAAAFAWLDDFWGPRQVILISLAGLVLTSTALIIGSGPLWFWIFGPALGFFVGPAQAASRSLMAHLAPPGQEAASFGFFALSGKATAFIGPALLAWVTAVSQSQRIGMATILIFLIAGGLLLWWGVRPKIATYENDSRYGV